MGVLIYILINLCKMVSCLFLILLILLLLIILLILVSPIHYGIKISKDDQNTNIYASTSWFFRFLYICYELKDGVNDLTLKICGMKVDISKIRNTQNANTNTSNKKQNEKKNKKRKSRIKNKKEIVVAEKGKRKKVFQRIQQIFHRSKWHYDNICDIIGRTNTYYLKIKGILTKDIHKASVNNFKKGCIRLWNQIKPYKLRLNAKFGFEDPSYTGKSIGAIAMIYPFLSEYEIDIDPDFENAILDIQAECKGRIFIYKICFELIKMWKNKMNRYTLYKIKRVKF